MKRTVLLLMVMLLAVGGSLVAQEGDDAGAAEEREEVITLDASLGFPTQLAAGVYWPIGLNLPNGILSGIEITFGYGTWMKGPVIFAKEDQEELTEYDYTNYPDPPPDSLGRGMSFRTYLTAYELELGFGTLPIKTGLSFNFGSIFGPDEAKYMLFDAAFLVKAEARLNAFSLLKPYFELGIGGGSGSGSNDAAKQAISGLTGMPTDTLSDDATKWLMGGFNYTNLTMNAGVRMEVPFFWNKKQEEPAEEEAEPEPEPMELLSEFQFPEWLMDRGGMAYFPEGRDNPMAGSITVGPQKVFRNYSFKHQSSYEGNKFNYKYEPESIVEIVQSDEEVWHAILRNDAGEEMEYKLYKLTEGEPVTIEGEEIDPVADGCYYDGNVYHMISIDM